MNKLPEALISPETSISPVTFKFPIELPPLPKINSPCIVKSPVIVSPATFTNASLL